MQKAILALAAVAAFAAPASAASLLSKAAGLFPIAANQPALFDTRVASFSTNLVTNGSFETGDFTGWEQVNDISFTFVTNELAAGGPTDGEFHAAFGPIDPGGGGIIQDLATIAGETYTVSFDLANLGGTPNAFGLFWDGGFVDIFFDLPGFDYESFSVDLVASSSSTEVGFIFYNEPSFFLLDNVSVTGGVIPEPATWAMMIAGFGLVGASLRRRRMATVSA